MRKQKYYFIGVLKALVIEYADYLYSIVYLVKSGKKLWLEKVIYFSPAKNISALTS